MVKIPFFEHDLGEKELEEIAKVFEGNILTTGDKVVEFEERFSGYLGVGHAVGLTSCTAALQLSLTALGIGEGDEVITTPMSFIATSTAIIQAGATPVFVDVEKDTGNIDASKIEKSITKNTRAIMPVHLYGLMCDMKEIRSIADRYGLKIIEDSAHCIEGYRDGIRPGQLGDASCFSFYATKNITCGEGGAVATNDADLAQRIRLMRTHGMDKTAADREKNGYSHWDMSIFGWKYNMDNIQAAMLLPQFKRLDKNHEKRHELVRRYKERLASVPMVTCFNNKENARHSYHLMPIMVPVKARDPLLVELSKYGIGVVVNYRPIHLFKYFMDRYGYYSGMFPVSEIIGASVISLPLYPRMPLSYVERVSDVIEESIVRIIC